MSGARILIVDDDRAILTAVRRALEARSYDVELLERAEPIAAAVARFRPDVLLLDLVLPDGDGIEICRTLRRGTNAAIILLSAVGDESKKVEALDAGAEDYVTKPFGMEELLARVRVALRRRAASPGERVLCAGPIRLDLEAREVSAGGVPVHLTPTEFDLLRLFLIEQGRVLTQRLILERVWGPEYVEDRHSSVRSSINCAASFRWRRLGQVTSSPLTLESDTDSRRRPRCEKPYCFPSRVSPVRLRSPAPASPNPRFRNAVRVGPVPAGLGCAGIRAPGTARPSRKRTSAHILVRATYDIEVDGVEC